jgi:hypothetical protein
VRLANYGLTMREPKRRDLRGYVEFALRGGYPAASLRLSDDARWAWLDGYFVLDLMPAWTANRLSRLVQAPKR